MRWLKRDRLVIERAWKWSLCIGQFHTILQLFSKFWVNVYGSHHTSIWRLCCTSMCKPGKPGQIVYSLEDDQYTCCGSSIIKSGHRSARKGSSSYAAIMADVQLSIKVWLHLQFPAKDPVFLSMLIRLPLDVEAPAAEMFNLTSIQGCMILCMGTHPFLKNWTNVCMVAMVTGCRCWCPNTLGLALESGICSHVASSSSMSHIQLPYARAYQTHWNVDSGLVLPSWQDADNFVLQAGLRCPRCCSLPRLCCRQFQFKSHYLEWWYLYCLYGPRGGGIERSSFHNVNPSPR